MSADLTELPPEAESAMIARHGEWEVRLVAPGARLKALSALRALWGLTLSESKALIGDDGVLDRGTRSGALWLAARLRERGIASDEIEVCPRVGPPR